MSDTSDMDDALDRQTARTGQGRAPEGKDPVTTKLTKAFYQACKARGMRHQAALRALAFKWIRVLYRCWVERTPYDESRYLMALQKRHAPLLKFAADSST
jgi:hypothetical protein